jgi:hypothetical protein
MHLILATGISKAAKLRKDFCVLWFQSSTYNKHLTQLCTMRNETGYKPLSNWKEIKTVLGKHSLRTYIVTILKIANIGK